MNKRNITKIFPPNFKTLLTLSLIFSLNGIEVGAIAKNPENVIMCRDREIKFEVRETSVGKMLRVDSLNERPLMPSIDRRVRGYEVGPVQCAQMGSGKKVTVCFTDACMYTHYFDFEGKKIEDVAYFGNPLFTAFPDRKNDYSNLNLKLEIQSYISPSLVIEKSFEIDPGNHCRIGDKEGTPLID